MSRGFDAEEVRRAAASARWSALVRTGLDLASLGTWDGAILRQSRVLVPVDVQALVVAEGDEPGDGNGDGERDGQRDEQ